MENVVTIIVATLGSAGLSQLIMFWLNKRANQRKANAEADVQEVAVAAAVVGIEKTEAETDRALVAGAGELTQHALNLLEVYRKDNEAFRAESTKMSALNRELLAQAQETQQTVERFQARVTSMELVIVDMATGLSRLSQQLEETGISPAWKPTLILDRMEKALTPEVLRAVRELFK